MKRKNLLRHLGVKLGWQRKRQGLSISDVMQLLKAATLKMNHWRLWGCSEKIKLPRPAHNYTVVRNSSCQTVKHGTLWIWYVSSPASSLWTVYVWSKVPKGLKFASFSSSETKSSVLDVNPAGMISRIFPSTSSGCINRRYITFKIQSYNFQKYNSRNIFKIWLKKTKHFASVKILYQPADKEQQIKKEKTKAHFVLMKREPLGN